VDGNLLDELLPLLISAFHDAIGKSIAKKVKAHHQSPGVTIDPHHARQLYHDYALANKIATPEEIIKREKESNLRRKNAIRDQRINRPKGSIVNQLTQDGPIITELQKQQIRQHFAGGHRECSIVVWWLFRLL
jgi:hypothetical protein